MVDSVLSLSNRGLRDWVIQRVTAMLIGIYTLLILGFIVTHPQLQFDEWQMLYSYSFIKVLSFLVLFSILLHTWIGMWTVFTDYIKIKSISLILQVLMIILLFGCLVFGAEILWGS